MALLIAILLPALGTAREAARGIQCLSMQRQLGLAASVYAADSDEYLFPHEYRPNGSTLAWSTRRKSWNQVYLHNGYLNTPNAFYCPSDFPTRSEEDPNWDPVTENWTNSPRTLGYRYWADGSFRNGFYDGGLTAEDRFQPVRISNFSNPGSFLLIADTMVVNGSIPDGQFYYLRDVGPGNQFRVALRHNLSGNGMFLDGHGERITHTRFEEVEFINFWPEP